MGGHGDLARGYAGKDVLRRGRRRVVVGYATLVVAGEAGRAGRALGGAGLDRKGRRRGALPVRRRRVRRRWARARLEWDADPNAVGFYERMGATLSPREPPERVGADTSRDGNRAVTRIAVLCDIHGNLPALEAVVPELDVDLVVVGGDVASGPFPLETLAAAALASAFRCGSCGATPTACSIWTGIPEPNRSARLWVAERLGEENLQFLRRAAARSRDRFDSTSVTERREATRSRSRE